MHRFRIFLLASVSLVSIGPLFAQETPTPQLNGYVTRVGTPGDFDVNGIRVLCQPGSDRYQKNVLEAGKSCPPHVFGEHLLLFGRLDKKSSVFHPTRIDAPDRSEGQSLSGFAVIDALLAPDTIRADGYAIEFTPETKVVRESPLSATAAPKPGLWIRYAGKRVANGAIQASTLKLSAPEVNDSEQELRDKNEFDPAAVSEDDRQSRTNKFFRGTNYKRVPAARNDALQSRVRILGERLVPVMQKQLAEDDPNKIHFRFQIVESLWKDAITMPNGIILVPEPLAEILNDDQLAAVLADNIATALQKQSYRTIPGNNGRTVATVGTLLIPGVGLATAVGASVSAHNDEKHLLEQSGRSALVLMHDAGFDIQQAPLAWWRLSTSKPDFHNANVPYRAAYLFQTLATEWTAGSPLNRQPLPLP